MADFLGPAGLIIVVFIAAIAVITGTYFVSRVRRRLKRLRAASQVQFGKDAAE